jgi:hypothetical protein
MATRNRYAELMAQYQQAQPFSFTGYPSTYTGGYDAAQPQAYAAPVNRYADIMAQPAMGGQSGRPVDYNPEWTALTDAEKAAYYRENPFEGKLALLGHDIFGNLTLPGNLAKNFNADNYYNSRLIKQGYDPSAFAFGPPNLTGGFVAKTPAQAAAEAVAVAQAAAQTEEDARQPITESRSGGGNVSQRGGESVGGYSGEGASRANSGQFGMGPGTAGFNGGSGFAQGGHVSIMDLQGPNPMGPDDGYGALKDGEFVINNKAVTKYGIELMNAINSGKIPKGKLLGLLEM